MLFLPIKAGFRKGRGNWNKLIPYWKQWTGRKGKQRLDRTGIVSLGGASGHLCYCLAPVISQGLAQGAFYAFWSGSLKFVHLFRALESHHCYPSTVKFQERETSMWERKTEPYPVPLGSHLPHSDYVHTLKCFLRGHKSHTLSTLIFTWPFQWRGKGHTESQKSLLVVNQKSENTFLFLTGTVRTINWVVRERFECQGLTALFIICQGLKTTDIMQNLQKGVARTLEEGTRGLKLKSPLSHEAHWRSDDFHL